MTRVAGLLLAAGASSRMGKPKQLLPAGGSNLLDRILDQALRSELASVTLVLGFQASKIWGGLHTPTRSKKLNIIENLRYEEGISSSIIAGLAEVEDRFDHVMIMLADMPHVTSNLIDLLLKKYGHAGLPLGAVVRKGRRTHPVIIHRTYYEELRGLRGDKGARDLFQKHADKVCLVEPPEAYDDMDIDTPEDYQRFLRSLQNNGLEPSPS